MTRRIEPIDLMVAVGAFATIIAGYFFYMAANGTLEAVQPRLATVEQTTGEVGPMVAMEWVQPALGQALVQSYLLERAMVADIETAARELNRVALLAQYQGDGAIPSVDDFSARMMALDADHAARVQFVLGRSISVFTQRGVRSGILSPGLMDGPFNQRHIALTEGRGHGMDSAYQETREPMLGRMIVAGVQASHETMRAGERIQDALGNAIIRIASLQERSQAPGDGQTQLALLTLASIHTEEMADRFERLAKAEMSLQPVPTVLSEPRTWPEIPNSLFLAGSLGLIGLFWIGLTMPGTRPEEAPTMGDIESEPAYRKTA